MATTAEQNAKVRELLAKGDVAGAQAALAERPSDASNDEVKAAEPPKRRDPGEIVLDILAGFNNILGNHPAIAPLMAELKDAVTPSAAKPPTS